MTLEEVYHIVPQLKDYLTYMPEEYKKRLIIKVHPSGYIIHQKIVRLTILELLPVVNIGSLMNLRMAIYL